jgi:uncharacterized protein
VVSSDHQIQRAARRRRATSIDSDQWFMDVCRQRRARSLAEPAADDRPPTPNTVAELNYWVNVFSEPAVPDESEPASEHTRSSRDQGGPPNDRDLDLTNPFPPGYADDLLVDDEGKQ